MSEYRIVLEIDGETRAATVEGRTLLVHALRESYGVTGPHVGCETGRCGACTVQLDGQAVKSCLILAVSADEGSVITAAGLARGDDLHPLQRAFHEHHALQCGYCTPGMLIAADELLRTNQRPSEEDIREALRGNLCRCTGYQHIIDAVAAVARS
jgi:carbon-monoxide dehydrogenase small subunit